MGEHLAVIYDSHLGAPVTENTIQKRVPTTSPAALQAANDTEAALGYCRDEVLPELDLLDLHVTRPLLDLLEIAKVIQKTMVKRNHKVIDYDRHRLNLSKLKAKTERSFSEEKQIFKTENALELATQDYEYLNDLLKQQLPEFFTLVSRFIEPVLEKYYHVQSKIYGMIYARLYELLNANLDHFITNQMGISQGFDYRRLQHDVRAEMENMDLLKSGGKAWLAASGGQHNSKLSLRDRATIRDQEQAKSLSPPPSYGASSSSPPSTWSQQQPTAPPAITSRAVSPEKRYVLALYDYQAQADGDLTFTKDDKIELIERTEDQNDWWTGKLNGKIGIFPGNYVSDL
ncbi:hypothetical protein DM01DRAFT_1364784 [Hesseltinella vesiculosa]|uniref:BAR-domain-containing protein n=1 Tax=Hesseltinella vesiculosa TaxID=101127 RepID=A0A1X2G423_9FUNG|nr:hypothetical protein DM01DRAFT_1364784 [Hesseltinella vesiculosa]